MELDKMLMRAGTLLAIAMCGGLLALPAQAADLGKDGGMQDLEERVAELEATAARKGNRKVTLTISGVVHKGILWHDQDSMPGGSHGVFFDPGHDPTRLTVKGEGKLNAQWKAGFVVEVGLTSSTAPGVDTGKALFAIPAVADGKNELQIGEMGTYIRHSYLYVEGPLGRVSLGQTSGATDGITEVNLANTLVAGRPLSLTPIQFGGSLIGLNIPFDGYRSNVVRWDSPTMGGFIASGSWSDTETWEVSLRYAGEFSGIRVAAGVGYRDASKTTAPALNIVNVLDLLTLDATSTHKALSGSASVMHMGTGLFVTGFASKVDYSFTGTIGILPPIFTFSFPAGGLDAVGYGLQAGWEKNVTGYGNTTLYAEWQKMESRDVTSPLSFGNMTSIGFGAVQSIDAMGLDIYANFRRLEMEGDADASIVTGGARIRF